MVHALPVVAVDVTWAVGAAGAVSSALENHSMTEDLMLALAVVWAERLVDWLSSMARSRTTALHPKVPSSYWYCQQ